MPLTPAAPRKHIHTREIHFAGYEREDGLFDIEAHMTDTKTYSFGNDWRGEISPGQALHEMLVRVTVDDAFIVTNVEASTENSPFQMCPDITPNYAALIGLRMGRGWREGIRERVGGIKGCTHITELLYQMATVAFQTISPLQKHRKKLPDSDTSHLGKKPVVLNTCHAWAEDSPVVKANLPKFYTGK